MNFLIPFLKLVIVFKFLSYYNFLTFPASGTIAQKKFHHVFKKMSPLRRGILKKLLRLLRLISIYSEINKMTVENLAIVITPNIIRPHDKMEFDHLNEIRYLNNAVSEMILGYTLIFAKEIENEDSLMNIKLENDLKKTEVLKSNSHELKLLPSLSELPKSKNGPKSDRSDISKQSNKPRNRGFSNALDWLNTIQKNGDLDNNCDDTLDTVDAIDAVVTVNIDSQNLNTQTLVENLNKQVEQENEPLKKVSKKFKKEKI